MNFEKIWNSYYKRLFVFCRQTYGLSKEDAEDVVQETLLKIYRNMGTYSAQYALSTWIFTIARNTCIDFKRSTRGHHAENLPDDILTGLPDPKTPAPPEITAAGELQRTIAAFIRKLPEDDRGLLYLRMYEDLPYREISRITGKPVGTIKYRFHSIRKQLQKYMGDAYEEEKIHGEQSPAANPAVL